MGIVKPILTQKGKPTKKVITKDLTKVIRKGLMIHWNLEREKETGMAKVIGMQMEIVRCLHLERETETGKYLHLVKETHWKMETDWRTETKRVS